MSATVAVTRHALPGDGVRRLAEDFQIRQWTDPAVPSRAELRDFVRGAEGILGIGSDQVDAALLDAAGEQLRVVGISSMGYDGVNLEAARERRVVVTHTPNVLHDTTADLAFALILMARRGLVEATDDVRAGRWDGHAFTGYLGLDVYGATLGIIGYGQIGKAVADRARGFGMRVQYLKPRSMPAAEATGAVDLETLLRTSDVISLHVPLTEETRGLIGSAELGLMKPTATLVNTARGGIVDEDALLEALRSGQIHSAGLDVMEREPRSDPNDPLFHEPRLVVLPHIGSATEATRARMADLAADNVADVLSGKPARTPIPGTAASYG